MIEVSEIKDVKELLEMKDDLNFFINKKIVAEIYKEEGKEQIELNNDRQLARELLNKVIQRLKQFNNRPIKKSVVPRSLETVTSPVAK